jgi:hypothetical protein
LWPIVAAGALVVIAGLLAAALHFRQAANAVAEQPTTSATVASAALVVSGPTPAPELVSAKPPASSALPAASVLPAASISPGARPIAPGSAPSAPGPRISPGPTAAPSAEAPSPSSVSQPPGPEIINVW